MALVEAYKIETVQDFLEIVDLGRCIICGRIGDRWKGLRHWGRIFLCSDDCEHVLNTLVRSGEYKKAMRRLKRASTV